MTTPLSFRPKEEILLCFCAHPANGLSELKRLADLHDALIFFAGLDGEAEACHQLEHFVIVAQHFAFDHRQALGARSPC